jgi:hypothetical protein
MSTSSSLGQKVMRRKVVGQSPSAEAIKVAALAGMTSEPSELVMLPPIMELRVSLIIRQRQPPAPGFASSSSTWKFLNRTSVFPPE